MPEHLAYAVLEDRGILEVAGEDRVAFLQGLVSNDVTKAGPARALYAALLTAQGRYLHDFMVLDRDSAILLEGEAVRLDDLRSRLARYTLRSRVTLRIVSELFIAAAAFGAGAARTLALPEEPGAARAFGGGIAYVDPRLAALGVRLLLPRADGALALAALGFAAASPDEYERLRLIHGVPDGSRDLPVEKALLIESGFDELHGIDWQKGCYIGQELTARMRYRALVKKRLMPVAVEGTLPPPDTPVMLGDDEAGEMRSGRDGVALAMLRLDAVEKSKAGAALTAGEALLTVLKPEWMAS
jgi:transferase CAF17, mitochondrial